MFAPLIAKRRPAAVPAVKRKDTGTRLRETIAPPIVGDVFRGPGKPLDAQTIAFMEPRFGHDFSRVRVHTDAHAAEAAHAVEARAYTVGSNIVFGGGPVHAFDGFGKKADRA